MRWFLKWLNISPHSLSMSTCRFCHCSNLLEFKCTFSLLISSTDNSRRVSYQAFRSIKTQQIYDICPIYFWWSQKTPLKTVIFCNIWQLGNMFSKNSALFRCARNKFFLKSWFILKDKIVQNKTNFCSWNMFIWNILNRFMENRAWLCTKYINISDNSYQIIEKRFQNFWTFIQSCKISKERLK